MASELFPADVPAGPANLAPQGSIAPPAGMRTLNVDTAYGRKTVYVPLSMSPDEALAAVRQHIIPKLEAARQDVLEGATKRNAAQADLPIFLPGIGPVTIPGKYVIAAGEGFNSLVQGTKQLLGASGAKDQDAQEAAAAQQMQRFYDVFPEAKAGYVAGQAAPIAAVSAAVTPAAAIATPLRALINAGVQGGVASGIPYVPPGGSRAANMAEGARNALLMQAPFSILGKAAQGPKNVLTGPQAAAVEDMTSIPGVSPLPSQLTGNPSLANVEKVAAYFPFSGGQIAERTAANRQAVSAQVLKTLGAPEGTQYGTPDVLSKIKSDATKVMRAVEESGVPVQLAPDKVAALDAIRTAELRTNSPNAKLIGTINKLIGDGSAELRPEIASLGPDAQAQAIAAMGKDAFQGVKGPPRFSDGLPMDFFQSVQSDLSELSSSGVHLAGKANQVLTDAAVESLPGTMGADLQNARQQYGALKVAESAFDPATGNVDVRKLTGNLSNAGPDVARYLDSSNPRLIDLANTANAARGMPPVPAAGSDTAQKLAWQHWLGTIGELGAAGAAGLAGHMVSGGDLAATAGAGILPFLFANYGTKAYLSPAFARYVQGGIPTLGQIAQGIQPAVSATEAGLAAGLSSQ